MDVFRPIPVDVIQINEKSVVDLFIKIEDRLMPFLVKRGSIHSGSPYGAQPLRHQ